MRVLFTLTDLDYKPLPDQSVRLVFGGGADWQRPEAGQRFVTGTKGDASYTTMAVVDEVSRKRPTNFADSLLSRPVATDHVMVGAELEYATYRWLYTVNAYRFRDNGDVVSDGVSIYSRDARGWFTNKATNDSGGWRIADLNGQVLTNPGHDSWDVSFAPANGEVDATEWTLKLSVKRSPAPVRR